MKRFLEFDRQMDLLVAQKRIPEAIALMEQNRSRYPDQEYLLVCNILYCHREMGSIGAVSNFRGRAGAGFLLQFRLARLGSRPGASRLRADPCPQ